MEGIDEMMESNAIAGLRRGIGGLYDSVFWMEATSDHHKVQAERIKNHIRPLEGILGAMMENRRMRRDKQS